MRKLLIVALLLSISLTAVGCGCGGESGGNGNGGKIDYGDKNPNEGKIISSTSTDPNALKPAKDKELVGEMKIPPHPVQIWTLYAFEGLEVAGEQYQGWTEVPLTKEMYDSGTYKMFTWDKNPKVTFKVVASKDKAVTNSDPATIKPQLENYIASIQATKDKDGEFKHTQSLIKGIWQSYSYKKDGADYKGKVLAYSLRGIRVSETEFGPGTFLKIIGEGPSAAYDEAVKDTMDYMIQQVMITQVSE
ncbi:MAG: hypothetical protein ABFD23_05795 [Caldisericales bacterium]|jgi:hypothetical protein|nr:hypothetical protein [bacterium]